MDLFLAVCSNLVPHRQLISSSSMSFLLKRDRTVQTIICLILCFRCFYCFTTLAFVFALKFVLSFV